MPRRSDIQVANEVTRCTKGQREMVRLHIAEGYSKQDAFVAVFPDRAADARTRDSLARMVRREFEKVSVAAEAEAQERALNEAVQDQAKKDAQRILRLWTRVDSVKRLVSIADDCRKRREAAGAETMDRDAIAAAKLEKDTIDTLNGMLGYNAPIQIDADNTVRVVFGNGDGDNEWAK